jgi:squalene-hopene/tetraprenyl-beta-curcumene cyclase
VGAVDEALERRLVRRMRETQAQDGGWRLYSGGRSYLSITIQAYFAAKLAGVSADEPWMRRAREFILREGGVEQANVITKFYLALFGQCPWDWVPAMPIAVMLVPRGTVFNIYEMSYWARTCVVPLLVLYYQKRTFSVPAHAAIPELFREPQGARRRAKAPWHSVPVLSWRNFFRHADRVLKMIGKLDLNFRYRRYALELAERWILEHQDKDGGWGGIFPAMTHSVMALHVLGYSNDSKPVRMGLEAISALEITEGETTRVQPCLSPVWDTAWAVIALAKAGLRRDHKVIRQATDWLYSRQIRRRGDWAIKCPEVPAGGWAFQFHNDFYPDTDDTSAVLMALLNSHYRDDERKKESFDLGVKWLLGLQNDDGGWGAFERKVENTIWNDIPFNDAQNMLDPSTADVTGRCLELLAKLGYPRTHPAVARAIRFLKKEQERDGKWWGRWGVNYIYGTWSALSALGAAKEPPDSPCMIRGANWLESVQNPDGGWGESCRSYEGGPPGRGPSTASQTAWAIMGLLAAGAGARESCRRGVEWLLANQTEDGRWEEEAFTGTGFPGVFYLRYHGYRAYFPLLALARYREIME